MQMIEESEERLTEEQIEQLLDIIATTLPGDDTTEDEQSMETEDIIPAGEWTGDKPIDGWTDIPPLWTMLLTLCDGLDIWSSLGITCPNTVQFLGDPQSYFQGDRHSWWGC